MKTQVVVDKNTQTIICTNFCNGKKHDFNLFKESEIRTKSKTETLTDTGYLGIKNVLPNARLPQKKTKKNPPTKEQKQSNRLLSGLRVLNEHVIGRLKRFRAIAEKYRNRGKRFALRFNLIAGIYNFEMGIS